MTFAHFLFYARRGFFTLIGVFFIVYLTMILVSYSANDPSWSHISSDMLAVANMGGARGAWIADLLLTFVGRGIWCILLFVIYEILLLWWQRRTIFGGFRLLGYVFLLFAVSALLSMKTTVGQQIVDELTGNVQIPISIAENMLANGGIIGYELAVRLQLLLNHGSTWLFLLVFVLIMSTLAFDIRWRRCWTIAKNISGIGELTNPQTEAPLPDSQQQLETNAQLSELARQKAELDANPLDMQFINPDENLSIVSVPTDAEHPNDATNDSLQTDEALTKATTQDGKTKKSSLLHNFLQQSGLAGSLQTDSEQLENIQDPTNNTPNNETNNTTSNAINNATTSKLKTTNEKETGETDETGNTAPSGSILSDEPDLKSVPSEPFSQQQRADELTQVIDGNTAQASTNDRLATTEFADEQPSSTTKKSNHADFSIFFQDSRPASNRTHTPTSTSATLKATQAYGGLNFDYEQESDVFRDLAKQISAVKIDALDNINDYYDEFSKQNNDNQRSAISTQSTSTISEPDTTTLSTHTKTHTKHAEEVSSAWLAVEEGDKQADTAHHADSANSWAKPTPEQPQSKQRLPESYQHPQEALDKLLVDYDDDYIKANYGQPSQGDIDEQETDIENHTTKSHATNSLVHQPVDTDTLHTHFNKDDDKNESKSKGNESDGSGESDADDDAVIETSHHVDTANVDTTDTENTENIDMLSTPDAVNSSEDSNGDNNDDRHRYNNGDDSDSDGIRSQVEEFALEELAMASAMVSSEHHEVISANDLSANDLDDDPFADALLGSVTDAKIESDDIESQPASATVPSASLPSASLPSTMQKTSHTLTQTSAQTPTQTSATATSLPELHDDQAFIGKSRAFQTAKYRQNLSPIPSLEILDKPDPDRQPSYTSSELQQLSELLEIKLQDFNIKADVVNAIPGPVVTRFEVELAPGVKASKVVNISRDLARSLSMASLRVVEVIPGKPYIGIEVPNRTREMVRLIELLDTDKYRDPHGQISMAMGKNIGGKPIITDLAKAPHMLVAGTTGSGKSVLVNSMLLSMLLKYTPKELRLILIDPKQLELANYNDIPHLLTPVVTDMTEAAGALAWCVAEMERRYQLMSLLRVRKLKEFNKKVIEAEQDGNPIIDPLWRPNDSVSIDKAPKLKPLPMVVIVADEFADMIMQVGKQAEELITRLAQKSRAAGIHLMLATQRPSVDVITGLIKANVPVRAALRVNSKVDSRTILDQGGAEDMLGNGDMLFLGPGQIEPERVHGAFVSDEEVNRVCEAWRERGAPDYIENFSDNFQLAASDSGSGGSGGGTSGEDDSFYNEAVAFVLETRKVSASSIQRKFSIGYNRAARIVDSMEQAGIVSPMIKGKREILV